MMETEFIVYRWTDEDMTFVRRLFVKHKYSERVTEETVLWQLTLELDDFRPGLYRAVPVARIVDFKVTAEVELA